MKIGIIGSGNMGQALLAGIIAQRYVNKNNLLVSDKDKTKINFVHSRFKVKTTGSNSELIKKSKVIILALLPKDVPALLGELALPVKGKLFISICAGITTRNLEKYLGKAAVIRVMPNLAAQIGQGISVITLGKYAAAKDRRIAVAIFSCIGEVVQLPEKLMDAATAISGSGPAYFFYLAESLIAAGKKLGIPAGTAQRLAIKTALGAAMLLSRSKESAQVLRKRVSSKGGITEAAFRVFKKRGLAKLLQAAFFAAAKRAKELEKRL